MHDKRKYTPFWSNSDIKAIERKAHQEWLRSIRQRKGSYL
jgi:hypothetical protein